MIYAALESINLLNIFFFVFFGDWDVFTVGFKFKGVDRAKGALFDSKWLIYDVSYIILSMKQELECTNLEN